jgi:hypothetical protein
MSRTPSQPLKRDSLWMLTIAPPGGAAHPLRSDRTAAVWCAKFAPSAGSLGRVPTLVALYTVLALVAIGVVGWEGWRRHQHGTEANTHDLDTPEDRHRFLGFATLLLAGLSAVGVAYAAMAAAFFDTCR